MRGVSPFTKVDDFGPVQRVPPPFMGPKVAAGSEVQKPAKRYVAGQHLINQL